MVQNSRFSLHQTPHLVRIITIWVRATDVTEMNITLIFQYCLWKLKTGNDILHHLTPGNRTLKPHINTTIQLIKWLLNRLWRGCRTTVTFMYCWGNRK